MAFGLLTISFDFTGAHPGVQTTATIERGSSSTGPWTHIATVDLLAEQGIYTDTTAPLNEEIWYQVSGFPTTFPAIILLGPFVNLAEGLVLLKDPLRPWANIELAFCATSQQALDAICAVSGPELIWVGLGPKTYRSDANLFDVYGSRVPADIFGVRKRLDSEMRLLSKTLDAKDAVEALFAGGGPLQLQLPPEYGLPDMVVQPGDLVEDYLSGTRDQRRPQRIWSAPFTTVDTPFGGNAQGTECANWCVVEETFTTFLALFNSGYSWGNVAAGTAVCPEGEQDGFGFGPFGDGPFGDGG